MSRTPEKRQQDKLASPIPAISVQESSSSDPTKRWSVISSASAVSTGSRHKISDKDGAVLTRSSHVSEGVATPASPAGVGSYAVRPHRSETLVIVRPPPSQIRHPLNLQVQLIKASSATGTSHHGLPTSNPSAGDSAQSLREWSRSNTDMSLDAVAAASVTGTIENPRVQASAQQRNVTPGNNESVEWLAQAKNRNGHESDANGDEKVSSDQRGSTRQYTDSSQLSAAMAGNTLSRSSSVRSTKSNTSVASSHGSSHYSTGAASTSTAGSGSGQRRVLPCYNLEFHSLQPSFVTDAVTDVKIAKIHKRGIEMLDFAYLDPVFLSQARTVPPLSEREQARRIAELSRTTSTTQELIQKPTTIFNKIKRFSFKSSSGATEKSLASHNPSGSKIRNSLLGVATPHHHHHHSGAKDPLMSISGVSIVPLFREKSPNPEPPSGTGVGLPHSPSVSVVNSHLKTQSEAGSAPLANPAKHASGYVWIVRQYLRKDLLSESAGANGSGEGLCDVTFEWRKRRRRTGREAYKDKFDHARLQQSRSRSRPARPASSTNISYPQETPTKPAHQTARSPSPGSTTLNSRRHSTQVGGNGVSTEALRDASSPSDGLQAPSTQHSTEPQRTDVSKLAPFTTPLRNARSVEGSRSMDAEASPSKTGEPVSQTESGAPEESTLSLIPSHLIPASFLPTSWSSSPSQPIALLGKGLDKAVDLLNPNKLLRTRSPTVSETAPTSLASAAASSDDSGPKDQPGVEAPAKASDPHIALVSERTEALQQASLSHEDAKQDDIESKTRERARQQAEDQLVGKARRGGSRNRQIDEPVKTTTPEEEEDSGEESDPEDSERPWICELVIKRPSIDPPVMTTQRVLLGTLTPAPHHPKMVAHLGIPLSLSPVNIAPFDSQGPQLSFSTEELKDIMTVTALWLVVRENLGLGGIHKARKNEGAWRFATPAALK